MMNRKEIVHHYATEAAACGQKIKALSHRGRAYVMAELATFGLFLAGVALYALSNLGEGILGAAGLAFLAYLVTRWIDVKNDREIRQLTRRKATFDHESAYMRGDFSPFDSGEKYVDASHPYSFDMDLFGQNSLFQRINRTISTGGSDALAQSLASLPKDKNEVEQRRQAIEELSRDEEWLIGFLSRGQQLDDEGHLSREKINSQTLTAIVEQAEAIQWPWRMTTRTSLILALASVALLALIIAWTLSNPEIWKLAGLWATIQLCISMLFCSRWIRKNALIADELHDQMEVFIMLIRHIDTKNWESARLRQIQETLFKPDSNAIEGFKSLSKIIKEIERGYNIIALVVLNMLYMSDFFTVRSFLLWQTKYLHSLKLWVEAVGQIDQLASMAMLKRNHPEATRAEIIDTEEISVEAENLRHPFLGEKAIGNDFKIVDGNYYIITGANMAGKSTFLRSVGVNYVLAINGMPVFADRFRASIFSLFSSMHTSDDLSHGISYFNAELLRLQQLIESCRKSSRTLIILDEILKGTNSLDKLNGSRMFLEAISALSVAGLIATHDLELSRMEEAHPDRFHNYCFEIELTDSVSYSYKISRGVARNQNATFLLRKILEG